MPISSLHTRLVHIRPLLNNNFVRLKPFLERKQLSLHMQDGCIGLHQNPLW